MNRIVFSNGAFVDFDENGLISFIGIHDACERAYTALLKRNKQLEDHISKLSCCCAGCTKHNALIGETE